MSDEARLADELAEAVKAIDFPPSIQSQRNIRLQNACDKAIAALRSVRPLTPQEPVAWQWRDYDSDKWYSVCGDIEHFREIEAKCLDSGEVLIRPLYAAPIQSSDGPGVRQEDSALSHGESLQQGPDTSSNPSTAAHPQGKGSGAASVKRLAPRSDRANDGVRS